MRGISCEGGTNDALWIRWSHRFGMGDELIQGHAPTVMEAHLFMTCSFGFVAMDRHGDVTSPFSPRLQRNDGRNEWLFGRAITGKERIGPNQPFHRRYFQKAAGVRIVLTLWRAHDKAEDAAGP